MPPPSAGHYVARNRNSEPSQINGGPIHITHALLAILAALILTSCGLTIQPPQYEAETAEGNACRNQCADQYFGCLQLLAENTNRTEICARGMKSGLDLEYCYQQCRIFHGGTFTPYEESRRTLDAPSGGECDFNSDCPRRTECVDGTCR